MGARIGNFRAVRAQLALRETLLFSESDVMLKAELMVFQVQTRVDAAGRLVDEATRGMRRVSQGLVEGPRTVRPAGVGWVPRP